jgi:hypothetical protein
MPSEGGRDHSSKLLRCRGRDWAPFLDVARTTLEVEVDDLSLGDDVEGGSAVHGAEGREFGVLNWGEDGRSGCVGVERSVAGGGSGRGGKEVVV